MKNIKIAIVIAFAFVTYISICTGVCAIGSGLKTFKLSEIETYTESSVYDTYTEVKLKNGEIIRFYDNDQLFKSKSDCYTTLSNVFADMHMRDQISTKDYERQLKNLDETVSVNTTTNNRNYLK